MKLRLSRLWPLGLFLAAAFVAVCLLWPALPEALVLQGPDGYPDLSRPSFARRAAWWLAKGPSCLNHDELLRILLPSPLSHEWSYVLSSALLATAVGAYLRAVRLPVAACFAGGLAMAFSCYHFTLVNAGHRGYLTMMPYAAALFALVETAARRPCPAAFALMGLCAVCGLSAQPDVMAIVTLSADTGEVISQPEIITRGFVYVKEAEDLMEELRRVVNESLDSCERQRIREWSAIKSRIKSNLSGYLYKTTRRSPMVLPVIIEV